MVWIRFLAQNITKTMREVPHHSKYFFSWNLGSGHCTVYLQGANVEDLNGWILLWNHLNDGLLLLWSICFIWNYLYNWSSGQSGLLLTRSKSSMSSMPCSSDACLYSDHHWWAVRFSGPFCTTAKSLRRIRYRKDRTGKLCDQGN